MAKKRETCFIQQPAVYEVFCDLCGSVNTTWSEYEHMIWCFECEKDTPGTSGIFGGPIPIQVSKMLGISFDKIEIATGDILRMKTGEKGIYWEKEIGEHP
ncbi:hypothetical protein KGP36_01830 [Patescibacteria group bacterium]|nr:hypothetical protein [Patescibacteria group bacterium]